MSLENIVDHIIRNADIQKETIIEEARQKALNIIIESKKEANVIYEDLIRKEKSLMENQNRKLIVAARLKNRNFLLQVKQNLISESFSRLKSHLGRGSLKKKQIFSDKVKEIPEDIDFYLNKLRADFENEVAKILFK